MSPSLAQRFEAARALLHTHFGYPDFRPAQRRVIHSVLKGRDTLAVLPTGAGKSICFQIPALVEPGLTLVISPLISLMQDQVSAALARGIHAAQLNSTLSQDQQRQVLERARDGQVKLLYSSPERLKRLVVELRELGVVPLRFVVDEAHCITEWGHDFRPSYRALRHRRARLGFPQAVALTGSATPSVRGDIARALGLGRRGCDLHVDSFDRPNIWFGVRRVRSERERVETLLRLLHGDDRTALVYAPTRATAEGLARVVTRSGIKALPYHAGQTKQRRAQVLEAFIGNEVEVVTATSAFGMGIDKPDVRLVAHWTMPPTPEAYYQEAGRAGRDGEFARAVLVYRPGDDRYHRLQLGVTFPPERLVEAIWGGRAPPTVPQNVRESAARLERELLPSRGPVDWGPVRRRRRENRARLAAVASYASTSACRRKSLIQYFGERLRGCAGCDRCRRPQRVGRQSPELRQRLRCLRALFRSTDSAWGSEVLAPATALDLAREPPANIEALAAVPGVGPTLAATHGPHILEALGMTAATEMVPPSESLLRLLEWRELAAGRMGVAPVEILPRPVLEAVVRSKPASLDQLARIPGVGPRFVVKFGREVLWILNGHQAPEVTQRG